MGSPGYFEIVVDDIIAATAFVEAIPAAVMRITESSFDDMTRIAKIEVFLFVRKKLALNPLLVEESNLRKSKFRIL